MLQEANCPNHSHRRDVSLLTSFERLAPTGLVGSFSASEYETLSESESAVRLAKGLT
jgi:hypothetical protein